MVAATCTHPLDLAKVRMQAAPEPGATTVGTMIRTVREGGVLALYAGLSASLLRQATYSTTRFGVYEWAKGRVQGDSPKTPSATVLLPLSMASGAIGGVVGNPADVTNVRMQNDRALPAAERRNYRNALDGIIRITREEGASTLFRGLGPNVLRGVLMTASQVVSYDRIKVGLVYLGMDESKRTTHFSASLLAGLVATTTCSPVDVIKTRIMNAAASGSGGAFATFKECIAKEGPMFAFRGWVPAFVRLGPQTIVTFLALEQLKKSGLGQRKQAPTAQIKAAL